MRRPFLAAILVASAAVLLSPFDGRVQAALVGTDVGTAGDPALSGSFAEHEPDVGSVTVFGGGSDIWNGTTADPNMDHFYYVYEPFTGDAIITARVDSVENTNGWAKAGVMMRDSLDADSMHAMVVLTPSQGVAYQGRDATAGASFNDRPDASLQGPYWVQLERIGTAFTARRSADGTTWTDFGAHAFDNPWSDDDYIGLAITSHNNSALCEAQFSNISGITLREVNSLDWDQAGSAEWADMTGGDGDDSHWRDPDDPFTPISDFPNTNTIVAINATNTDTVYVGNAGDPQDRQAYRLTVDGGGVEIRDGSSLSVEDSVSFAPGTALTLGAGSALHARNGSISSLTTAGDAVLGHGEALDVDTLTIGAGTFTKQGDGTLSVASLAAPADATLQLDGGGLSVVGGSPLGDAQTLLLNGGLLRVSGAGMMDDSIGKWDFEGVTPPTVPNLGSAGAVMNGTLEDNAAIAVGGGFDGNDAMQLDGNNDRLNFGDVDLTDSLGVFSVSIWFRRDADQASATNHNINNVLIAQSSGGANDNLEIGTEGDNVELYVDTGGTDGYNVAIPGGIANGAWHHLALTYDQNDANELKLYFNGEFVQQWGGPSGALAGSAASPLTFGIARPDIADPWGDFNGLIDNVRLFDRALAAAEVESLYGGGAGAQPYQPADLSGVDVLVTDDSTIEGGSPDNVTFASLTMQGGTLTTGGVAASIRFDGTTIAPAPGVTTVGFRPEVPTELGPIDAGGANVMISKSGSSELTVEGAGTGLQNASFRVEEGTLNVVGSAPWGESTSVRLSGGKLSVGPAMEAIGVNFRRDTGVHSLEPAERAGLLPQANWNNGPAAVSGTEADVVGPTAGVLVDNAGNPTTATLNFAADTTWSTDYGTATGNDKLMSGYADNTEVSGDPGLEPISFSFGNIPWDEYMAIVYVGSDGGGRIGSISANSGPETFFTTFGNGNGPSSVGFVEATAATQGESTQANYVAFSSLSGGLNIQHSRKTANSGVHGIQIVNAATTALDLGQIEVIVDGNSTLETAGLDAVPFGTLTLNEGGSLTTTGAGVQFAGTNVDANANAVGVDLRTETDLGHLNGNHAAAVFSKSGPTDLILTPESTSDVDDLTFRVAGGRLIGVAGWGASPFGNAALQIDGGELVLASQGNWLSVTFDNELTVANDGTLTAGSAGIGGQGPLTVTLGSPDRGWTLDGSLSVDVQDGYKLYVPGTIGGAGSLEVNSGEVVTGAPVTVADLNVTGTLTAAGVNAADVNIESRGTLNSSGPIVADNLNVSSRLRLTGSGAQRSITINPGGVLTLLGSNLDVEGATLSVEQADVVVAFGRTLTYDKPLTVGSLDLSGTLTLRGMPAGSRDLTISPGGTLRVNDFVVLNMTGLYSGALDATDANVLVDGGRLKIANELTAQDVTVTGGRFETTAAVTVDTMEITGGLVNPNGNPITVNEQFKLGSCVFNTDGQHPLTATGSNLVASTELTIGGGEIRVSPVQARTPGTVFVVSDQPATGRDASLVAMLEALDYEVDTRGMNQACREGNNPFNDATLSAAMNDADIVLVSRHTSSGSYDNDTVDWNGLETPLLLMSGYLTRDSRWGWTTAGSGNAAATNETMDVVAGQENHPFLEGLTGPVRLFDWSTAPNQQVPSQVYLPNTNTERPETTLIGTCSNRPYLMDISAGTSFDTFGTTGERRVFMGHWGYDSDPYGFDSFLTDDFKTMFANVLLDMSPLTGATSLEVYNVNLTITDDSTLLLEGQHDAILNDLTLDPNVVVTIAGKVANVNNLIGGYGSRVDGNAVTVRGVLSPGGSDSVATMTLAGLEITDRGTYRCEIGPSDNDLVQGSEDLVLAGTLDLKALMKLDPATLPYSEPYGRKTVMIIDTTDEEVSVWECFINYLDPSLPWVQDMLGGQPVVHPKEHIGFGVFTFPTPDGNGNELAVTYDFNSTSVDLLQAAAGDANGDGQVDASDIEAILSANLFGTGEPAEWTDGDFTLDGEVGGGDIQTMLVNLLFGQGPYAALDPGQPSDGPVVDVLIDGQSVVIDTHGTVINSYLITSAAGVFTGEDADNLGLFQEDTDDTLSGGIGFALGGRHLLGDVIGVTDVDLLGDLAATYTVEGAGGIYTANLIVVPEPGTLVLLATGALGLLLAMRRRKRRAA